MHEYDNCVVENENGAGVASGYVTRCDRETMTVSLTAGCLLKKQQPVRIYVHNSASGECRYEAEVACASANEADFTILKFTGQADQRQYLRISRQLHYRIYYRFQGDRKVKLPAAADITILNLGALGMLFNSEAQFEPGFIFPLKITDTAKPVELTVQVQRREEFQRSVNYGCVFRNISGKQKDELDKYVLREQIGQRREEALQF
ncbi:MAG: PilZ domain-containing protein [Clostridia bacterium]|nr:PilZ domain-containing protein [Clostridia bacterium]MDR3644411.1 PilZ domain-containing protein [Clostridia bacterium]